jgi:hypothetical protein
MKLERKTVQTVEYFYECDKLVKMITTTTVTEEDSQSQTTACECIS